MISIQTAVQVVVYLIIIGVIFGLLWWLLHYCAKQFPALAPFLKVANIILAILAVLVLIGVLLSFMGHPVLIP